MKYKKPKEVELRSKNKPLNHWYDYALYVVCGLAGFAADSTD